jgi:hypothetical protein
VTNLLKTVKRKSDRPKPYPQNLNATKAVPGTNTNEDEYRLRTNINEEGP